MTWRRVREQRQGEALVMDEQFWREKAEETRRLAQALADPLMKNELLSIVYSYERLAQMAREQKAKTPKRSLNRSKGENRFAHLR